jgi:Desulfoferrodoxin, N-terminal domain
MNKLGTRLRCETCGGELMVTKGGEGSAECCGQPMQLPAPSGAAGAEA